MITTAVIRIDAPAISIGPRADALRLGAVLKIAGSGRRAVAIARWLATAER
jgi:hypothetical protein